MRPTVSVLGLMASDYPSPLCVENAYNVGLLRATHAHPSPLAKCLNRRGRARYYAIASVPAGNVMSMNLLAMQKVVSSSLITRSRVKPSNFTIRRLSQFRAMRRKCVSRTNKPEIRRATIALTVAAITLLTSACNTEPAPSPAKCNQDFCELENSAGVRCITPSENGEPSPDAQLECDWDHPTSSMSDAPPEEPTP